MKIFRSVLCSIHWKELKIQWKSKMPEYFSLDYLLVHPTHKTYDFLMTNVFSWPYLFWNFITSDQRYDMFKTCLQLSKLSAILQEEKWEIMRKLSKEKESPPGMVCNMVETIEDNTCMAVTKAISTRNLAYGIMFLVDVQERRPSTLWQQSHASTWR